MKVVIITEFLHEKNWLTTHLEAIISLYPQAMIMSCTYARGKLGDKIEKQTIISSKLEPQKAMSSKWLIPMLIKNFLIPKDTDLVISLSCGAAHYVKIPQGVKHITYFQDKIFSPKIFMKPFLGKPRIDQALYINQEIAKAYEAHKPRFLAPFFKLGEHEFDEVKQGEREIDYIIHFSEKTALDISFLKKKLKGLKYLFLAPNKLLDKVITDKVLRSEHCYEKGCHGTQQKLLGNTKVFIDYTQEVFNPVVFQALSAGCAVYAPRDYYGEFLDPQYIELFSEIDWEFVKSHHFREGFDMAKARRQALRYNGRIFKRSFQKYQREIL